MRRAPVVLGSTAVGLVAILGFHTHGSTVSLVQPGGTSPAAGSQGSSTSQGSSSSASTGAGSLSSGTGPSGSVSGSSSTTPTTAASTAAARSAVGADEQTQYGAVQVKVTVVGSRITAIQTVQLSAFDPRSAQINAAAAPMLQQEALSAQSANINGVSGASYTSAAYIASLQSALDQLGFK
ncbi:MAG TPA: FMN-binding protein [Acidimicrobiales bacterium]|nr:FMN-binding protein [Acidimicrobiales bacterium]